MSEFKAAVAVATARADSSEARYDQLLAALAAGQPAAVRRRVRRAGGRGRAVGETPSGYAARVALAVARGNQAAGVDVAELRELAYDLLDARAGLADGSPVAESPGEMPAAAERCRVAVEQAGLARNRTDVRHAGERRRFCHDLGLWSEASVEITWEILRKIKVRELARRLTAVNETAMTPSDVVAMAEVVVKARPNGSGAWRALRRSAGPPARVLSIIIQN
ncbi:hypothetical protein [Spirilliplanes yamanashiensis]|uniref:Uncharacterized protein n=1 Tax=Spirilliplanes yamanashiensis TaxID=42233 RepID=A0A8J4DMP3_9ACTN|nr:hypothetical protein [Spirilliplanes yamanashiensis]MDP9818456.1 hypothetical protein [Spirilliplanes yamanashiensis]GIJ06419.1 hypothetical protein Sya03_57710 [Spirilliplanes yamanashiensis]